MVEIELVVAGDVGVEDAFFDVALWGKVGKGTASGTRGVEAADLLPALDGGEAFFH